MQQQPKGDVHVLDYERWGMFIGTYFWRIKLSELLEQHSSEVAPKRDSSLAGVHNAVSSLVLIASASSIVEKHASNDLERVLETPSE
jgi:hypothetical protein